MSNAETILKSFKESPENWRVDRFRIIHIPTGYSIWIANGFLFFQTESRSYPRLSFWERVRLWPEFKRIKASKLSAIWRESKEVE